MNKIGSNKRRGGQPKAGEKRTEMFAFLLTPSEKQRFLEYAGSRSVSAALRDLIRPVLNKEVA